MLKNSGQTPSFIKNPGREEKLKETKPHNVNTCLATKEAQTIYNCLELNEVVSPIQFCKDLYRESKSLSPIY